MGQLDQFKELRIHRHGIMARGTVYLGILAVGAPFAKEAFQSFHFVKAGSNGRQHLG